MFLKHLYGYMAILLILAGTVQAAGDPVLEGLIVESLAGNPGIRAMGFRTEAAKAARRQARSAYYPRLNTALTYTRTDNPPQVFMIQLNQGTLDMQDPAFDPNQPEDTGNMRFSLGLRYRLFDGARGAQTAAAGLSAQIAASREMAMRNALVHEVTQGYYQVLEAQAFVDVQAAALASLEESLRVANERFKSGSAVKTDVLNLEVQTAQASENLIRARNGVQLAIAALNAAIGSEIVPEAGLSVPDLTHQATETDATLSISNRPEYRLADLQVRAAEWMLKAVRRGRAPVLNAFGSVDWDSEDFSDAEQSYLAGASLEWEVFSGFEQAGKVAEAKAELEAAQAQRERVRQQLELDLKQARLNMETSWARLQVTLRAVDGADEALRITRARYKEGAAEISVLLVAELGLTETRMRHTAASYDYRIALSNLDRAAGLPAERDRHPSIKQSGGVE